MNQYGVLGNEVIVTVHALGEYPARLTPIEATSIWIQYLTAYGALVDLGRVKKVDFVLITAASSSTGLAAIEIVKAEGAISKTTRNATKRGELLVLGADHVIVTNEEDLVARVKEITNGAGAQTIFDPT